MSLPCSQRPRPEASSGERRSLLLAISTVHLGLAWALLQVAPRQVSAPQALPLVVDWLDPSPPPGAPEPPRPPAPAPTPNRIQTAPALPAPSLLAAAPAATPAPEAETAPARPLEPFRPEPVSPPPPTVPVAAAPAAPIAPQRRLVASTDVQYLTLPPVEVPRLSRRAGESGTVWLRVVVDIRGRPLQVSVKQSSGHTRLDEQAVWAMHQARFKPQTENGQPLELEVTAPIEYTLD